MEQTSAELWKQRSVAISATVKEVASVDEALQYALELCQSAEPHEQLMGPEPEGRGKVLPRPVCRPSRPKLSARDARNGG
ncbi:MAG: hypothetical protein V8Q84_02015 [Bilophila sp.]